MKNILCLCFALNFLSVSVFAGDGAVLFIKGKAFVNSKKVKKNSGFNYGDTFSTGEKSIAVIKIKPGLNIKLKENSILKIQKPKILKRGREFSYTLEAGEIFIQAKKAKYDKFNFKAADSIMGIRGTQFFISSKDSRKNNVWMCVNEGSVEVSVAKNKKTVLVKAGQGVNINSNNLPQVKQYEWTNDLNWKMTGSFDEINDLTDIQNINYDLESFDYD